MKTKSVLISTALILTSSFAVLAGEPNRAATIADRVAVERVYHEHRTGTKRPFEEAVPMTLLQTLARADAKKETVLDRVFRVKVTDGMLAAEVHRINTTTRAPAVLGEIKATLGNDPVRFARVVARPIVVERLLREKFDNDDVLHDPQRRVAELTRERLLASKQRGLDSQIALIKEFKDGLVHERMRWEMTSRSTVDASPSHPVITNVNQTKASGGPYSTEATAQIADVLSSPEKLRLENERRFYFESLPGELQNVLRVQLRQPGEVSAVIEGPHAFQIYLTRERTAEALTVAVFTITKRSYDEWLEAQPD